MDDGATEAPFVTENIDVLGGVGTTPDGTDVVEAGHNANGFAFLNGDLEWTEIDFAIGLLAKPGVDVAWVWAFLG